MSIKSNGAISIEQTIGRLQLNCNCTLLQMIKDMNQKIKNVFLALVTTSCLILE